MGEMRVLTSAGDIVVEWDADDPASVAKAKAEWDRLKEDGYEFFKPVEAKGKRLTRWDAKAGRLIAAPGVQRKQDKPIAPRARTETRKGAMAGGPNGGVMRPAPAFVERALATFVPDKR